MSTALCKKCIIVTPRGGYQRLQQSNFFLPNINTNTSTNTEALTWINLRRLTRDILPLTIQDIVTDNFYT